MKSKQTVTKTSTRATRGSKILATQVIELIDGQRAPDRIALTKELIEKLTRKLITDSIAAAIVSQKPEAAKPAVKRAYKRTKPAKTTAASQEQSIEPKRRRGGARKAKWVAKQTNGHDVNSTQTETI